MYILQYVLGGYWWGEAYYLLSEALDRKYELLMALGIGSDVIVEPLVHGGFALVESAGNG